MRRIEPAYPDLLPLSFQLGPTPGGHRAPLFDPVEMRLSRPKAAGQPRRGDRSIPRRPTRLLVHDETVRDEREHVGRLIAGGYGLLVIHAGALTPGELPPPLCPGQIVLVSAWLPALWGGRPEVDLQAWQEAGVPAGVLLGLGPCPLPFEHVREVVGAAAGAGAAFVVALPLVLPAEERHRVYDALAGEEGDEELENILFHTDLGRLTCELEREATRCCRAAGVSERLPGPGTSLAPAPTFAAGTDLLLWARRLDLLDGVSSMGWQLRRAAHALVASGRDPRQLVEEDNLRIIPGFTPWVEAFARTLWNREGAPFDEHLERWLAH
jgi:hypothetical protein